MSEAAEKNKALVRRFIEAQNKGDLRTLDELLAPDFVDHNLLPGQQPGREGFMQGVAEDVNSYTYIDHTIDYQATDGEDMVITRTTNRTVLDRGAYLGVMAPTGRKNETQAIVIHRIVGGKIAEEWSANSVAPYMEEMQHQARERERIEQELQVARRIQQASLFKEVPES